MDGLQRMSAVFVWQASIERLADHRSFGVCWTKQAELLTALGSQVPRPGASEGPPEAAGPNTAGPADKDAGKATVPHIAQPILTSTHLCEHTVASRPRDVGVPPCILMMLQICPEMFEPESFLQASIHTLLWLRAHWGCRDCVRIKIQQRETRGMWM